MRTLVQSLDIPNAGIEPASLVSPVVAGRFFTPVPCGKLTVIMRTYSTAQGTLLSVLW